MRLAQNWRSGPPRSTVTLIWKDAGMTDNRRASALNRALAVTMGLLSILSISGVPAAPAEQTRPAAPKNKAPYTMAVERYRSGRIAEAAKILESVIEEEKEAGTGIHSLLGWCYLRLARIEDAEKQFLAALALDPASEEAVDGLIAAYTRSGRREEALKLGRSLLETNPGNNKARELAERALAAAEHGEDRRLSAPAPDIPSRAVVQSRAGKQYLEIATPSGFQSIFIKGVNLGLALPGRYPSEFPEELSTYRTWFKQIGEMGANVVRVYTLFPPVFYQALREHNLEMIEQARAAGENSIPVPGGFLYLIHGVWTELPASGHYDDPEFESRFKSEIQRVLDALHGNIAVAYRPGHASGLYVHDVSSMTLAMILGREWESFSVVKYDAAKPGGSFRGKHFVVEHGTATEIWLASMMDHATEYESSMYGVIRPVTFTNWPTLDPMFHPTEASTAEDIEMRKEKGLPYDPIIPEDNADEDVASIDANVIRRAYAEAPGLFASYHAYPYYPDFMMLDPEYLKARDHLGPNNYVGYLQHVRRHHKNMPVLIAEIGVPTSRGVAHDQPQGFEHGGHGEKAQGEINARLMRNIHDTGCAGGIIFAWLDEWFKKNWQVMEFESPGDRNRKWLNAQDPEQNYGLLAVLPGSEHPPIVLDGKIGDWEGRHPVSISGVRDTKQSSPNLHAVWAAHDEAYFYLRVDTSGMPRLEDGAMDWSNTVLFIGIDTHGALAGDRSFPPEIGLHSPTGMEFMIRMEGPGESKLLVDPGYDLFPNRRRRPYRSRPNEDGIFSEIQTRLRVERLARDGTFYPEVIRSRSLLKRGTTDPNDPDFYYLADWIDSGNVIELRIPWGLLNVTDPSSHRVVSEERPSPGEVGTARTDGFRIYTVLFDPAGKKVLAALPGIDSRGVLKADPDPLYTWEGWEEPSFHIRPKKSYYILKKQFAALPTVIP
jgi:tetratricopeptide (TPR) repeat protein